MTYPYPPTPPRSTAASPWLTTGSRSRRRGLGGFRGDAAPASLATSATGHPAPGGVTQVREIAAQLDLITAEKKDSQGLCFIGQVRLPDFLQQQLQPKEGNIIEIDVNDPIYKLDQPTFADAEDQLEFEAEPLHYLPSMGKVVGKHQGAHYFTIGQRKGLNVGGTKEGLFIIATDVESNTIYTGQAHNHPGLFRKALKIEPNEIHWVREDLRLKNGDKMEVLARIRYRQALQKATIYQFDSGLYMEFEEPQSAINAGQFAAWYIKDELVGSGVIS